jgi:hypothetical protein
MVGLWESLVKGSANDRRFLLRHGHSKLRNEQNSINRREFHYDSKTQIRRVPLILAKEESQDWKTKESRHI